MPRPRPRLLPLLATSTLLLLGACASGARSAPPTFVTPEPEVELGEGPDLVDEEVTPVEVGLLGSVSYDLPVEANSWVEAELEYLVGQRRHVITRWIERGDFYEDFVKSVLRSHGLPTDLYHLAMIESGFVPGARSRVGALGLWQFMPATGRLEGLRVDDFVDERLDPVRATHAAARHLQSLHRQFNGDWALAAAAYNAGAGRIGRGLQKFAVSSFWELAVFGDLAEETKHYVPRLYAMTIIARDRARFGLPPASEQRVRFAYDSVLVDYATPLTELSGLGGLEGENLARLNPHLVRGTTPPGLYWVWTPEGTGDALQVAYLESEFRKQGGLGTYVVRRGDTMARLVALTDLPAARLRELNPRVNWDRLQPGTRLQLPFHTASALAARPAEQPAATPTRVAANRTETRRPAPRQANGGSGGSGGNGNAARARAPEPRYVQHVVKPGETLWAIARRYGVSMSAIQEANRLSGTNIVSGRTLRIPQQAGRVTTTARTGSERRVAEHVVKAGETLWSIAREYGASVRAIQNANRIEDNVIVPGQRLRIPL